MTHTHDSENGRTLTRCGNILREMVELLNDLIVEHTAASPGRHIVEDGSISSKNPAVPAELPMPAAPAETLVPAVESPPPLAAKKPEPPNPAVEIEEEIERALDEGFGIRPRTPAAQPPKREIKPKKSTAPAEIRTPGHAPGSLFLVCEGEGQRNVAIPWNWVVDTHLSESGAPEAFTLSDGNMEHRVKVNNVLGIWTQEELQGWQDRVRWLNSLQTLRDPSVEEQLSSQPEVAQEVATHGPPEDAAPDPLGPPESLKAKLARPRGDQPVWIVSPSALARRFLMRHLVQAGLNVREARGLDDPDLLADLERAGALFLDEGLRDQWRAHPTAGAIDLPVVQLTVDGALRIPPEGSTAELGAMLPRPFERSEVSAVVAWLRSLWKGDEAGGSDSDGDAEDNAWLYADPFGTADARERPGGG